MRTPVVVAATSLCLATANATAQTAVADVPFTLHQNAIIVEMVANGRDTLHLLLDTGWGPMALTDSALARLNRRRPTLTPASGYVNFSSLSIGALKKTNVPMEIMEAASLGPLIGNNDGVLATAFFTDMVLQVDYPKGRVRFFQRSPYAVQPVDAPGRSTIPMTFSSAAPGLPFSDSLWVNGAQVRGLFDTGGAGAFVAMPSLVRSQSLERVLDSTVARMGYFDGQQRQAPVRFARLQRVQVGRFVLDTPRTLIAPQQFSGNNWGHDLIVGYGFMRRYIVTFDYPGRRITFELPNSGAPERESIHPSR